MQKMEFYKNTGILYSLDFNNEVVEYEIIGFSKDGYHLSGYSHRVNKKTLVSENPFNGSEKKHFYKRNPKIKIPFTTT